MKTKPIKKKRTRTFVASFLCSVAGLALCGCGESAPTPAPGEALTGYSAGPARDRASGDFLFLVGEGLAPSAFAALLDGVGAAGWSVFAPEGGEAIWPLAVREHVDPARCSIIGGFGGGGVKAFELALAHQLDGGADGVIAIAAPLPDEANYLSADFTAGVIFAEHDPEIPPAAISMMARRLPGRAAVARFPGANRSQFAAGVRLEGDGEATISAEEQMSAAISSVTTMLANQCADRDRRMRDMARRKAREAQE